jgi:hypothetical protein
MAGGAGGAQAAMANAVRTSPAMSAGRLMRDTWVLLLRGDGAAMPSPVGTPERGHAYADLSALDDALGLHYEHMFV